MSSRRSSDGWATPPSDPGASGPGAAEAIAAVIRREGPITFDRFMAAALYGPGGFFAGGHGARRDFATSPTLGPLFGECTARALDEWWREIGRAHV